MKKKWSWAFVAVFGLMIATLLWQLLPILVPSARTETRDMAQLDLTQEQNTSLGMLLIDIQTQETAAHFHVNELGVYVLSVDEDSAASRAGLCSGDRIVSCNGQPISTTADFSELAPPSGEGVSMVVRRKTERKAESQTFVAVVLPEAND